MTTRYQEKHYEDVARILHYEHERWAMGPGQTAAYRLIAAFADLFAADNPPACALDDCGVHPGDGVGAGHLFKGGFNRADFLAACGLKSEETS